MDTLESFLAQVDAEHASSFKECDVAFEESVRWLDDTVAANKRTLAAQSCAQELPARREARTQPPSHARPSPSAPSRPLRPRGT